MSVSANNAINDKLQPGTDCVVCGDVATGNHYSVPSCNGCKTFFRRAIVNNRTFTCMGNGKCLIDKGVRCACRSCRLGKCLRVGMDPNAIQSERDRIGYTKRTRRDKQEARAAEQDLQSCSSGEHEKSMTLEEDQPEAYESDGEDITFAGSKDLPNGHNMRSKTHAYEGVLERLTQLENNFTLLLSRSDITPYASLEEALNASSRFSLPVNVKLSDPIVQPKSGKEQKMPFWRSRIIALYIDWAKTFATFRKLPYSDKVALITNHASSYMIMCEAFRTSELVNEDEIIDGIEKIAEKLPREQRSASLVNDVIQISSKISKLTSNSKQREPQKLDDNAPSLLRSGKSNSEPPEKVPKVETSTPPKDESTSSGGVNEIPSTPLSAGSNTTLVNKNMHAFFDPQLIRDGNSCLQTGVRSLVDVPPGVHYPTVGNLSGLTPVMAAMIDCVMKPFRKLNISTTEFAALQAIMFFDPDTEGLDAASQRNVCAEQKKMISAFYTHICHFYDPVEAEQRFSGILLRIPMIRKVAAKKNESLQIIDLFNLFTLNSLVKETTIGIKNGNAAASNA